MTAIKPTTAKLRARKMGSPQPRAASTRLPWHSMLILLYCQCPEPHPPFDFNGNHHVVVARSHPPAPITNPSEGVCDASIDFAKLSSGLLWPEAEKGGQRKRHGRRQLVRRMPNRKAGLLVCGHVIPDWSGLDSLAVTVCTWPTSAVWGGQYHKVEQLEEFSSSL